MNEKLIKPLFEDNQNAPFAYLTEKYSLNCNVLSQSSDIILSASVASAKKFEETTAIEINENLVHFFFDLFLYLSSNNFANNNKEISSAIIDGIHFKYFGQPSQNKITSSIELMAKKETCFLLSLFALSKKEDFKRMTAIFAFYTGTNDMLGASTGLTIAEVIFGLTNVICPKLNNKLREIEDLENKGI
jgi:hypothetical protein